jgi:hypothetical protein
MALIEKFKDEGVERLGNGVVAAGESVVRGTIAMFNASGYIEEVDDTAGCVFAGIVKASADEGESAEFDYGSPYFYPSAGAVLADIGDPVYGSGAGTLAKTSANFIPAGRIIDAEPGVGWWIDPLGVVLPAWGQVSTDAGGEVAVTGMSADGIVLVTLAEDPGSYKSLSDVVCGSGKFTVYATTGSARAALASKKINYLILAKA